MALRADVKDVIDNLKIQCYSTGDRFAICAPTWKISTKHTVESFYKEFEIDETGAMRDYASIPQHGLVAFFKDPDLIDAQARVREGSPLDLDTMQLDVNFKPKVDAGYFVGLDLSVRGDSTGFSLVHYDRQHEAVVADICVGIKAKDNKRIDYEPIRTAIRTLTGRGFNIIRILYDQFQSNTEINEMRKSGYDAREVKYADSFVGCTTVHEMVHTGKLIYYRDQEQLIGEMKELQVVNSKRIDHLQSGGVFNSKDAWDSLVNAVLHCVDFYYNGGLEREEAVKTTDMLDRMLGYKENVKENDSENGLDWLYE